MPPLLFSAQEKQIADQIFDRLADIGPDLNTIGDAGWTPRLATSWEWAADSMSIAFRLHPRARWHDGRPVTARDVRFSLDLTRDPRVPSQFADGLAHVDSISTPDSLTAVAWYSQRSPEQFYNLVYNLTILPEHLLRDADRTRLDAHPFSRSPVGSGPFRFVRWDPRVVIEVAADTAYYLGRPPLDRVVWSLNPDPIAALVNVLAGEADLLETVSLDGMARIAAQNVVTAIPYSSPNYGYMGFNYRDPKNPARPHPLFADRELRRAVAMAINRPSLLKNVYDSIGVLAKGPFSHLLPTADTTLTTVPFDSSGSDRLLDSLGWRDSNGDGVREKGGRPLRFGLLVPTSSVGRMRYAELIQAQLRPHGIRVDLDALEFPAFQARMGVSQFDAIVNNVLTDPSPSNLRETWHTMPESNRVFNLLLYGNPTVDAAIDSAVSEWDRARSREHYRNAYRQISNDIPAVWLYENRFFMALHGRVKPVLNGSDLWWSRMRLWSIPKAGRLPRDGK
jgi:peptide/nickel transport system substrate-binding protein